MRTFINAAGMVVLVAGLVIFCVLNIGKVDLNLIFLNLLDWKVEYTACPVPLCALVLIPLGCGIVLGCLLSALKIFRLNREMRALRKELLQRPNHSLPD